MTAESITLLIGALGTFLVIIGGGAKWMLSYLEAKDQASALRESEARNALSTRMNDEISALRNQLDEVRSSNQIYLRRVYQLEYAIHAQPGMTLPLTEGWPPK
jgi:hypothetical protein